MTFEELPTMEDKCRECDGTGKLPWVYETVVGKKKKKIVKSHKTCDKCHGKGKFLTPFGQAVIQLVKDWSPFENEFQSIRDEISDLDKYQPYDPQCD